MELNKGKDQEDQKRKEVPVHRVGCLTFGVTMIGIGVLFLMHVVFPELHYEYILRLWPCIFIILGLEILVANHKENVKFVYDKGSIFLIFMVLLFAMCMACVDCVFFDYIKYQNKPWILF